MRLKSSAALALAATLFAAPAFAQASFSLAAGATVPVANTADGAEVGYNAILGIGIKPPLAPLGLRIEGMFNSMSLKNTTSGSMRTLAGIANVTLSGVGMPIPMGYLIGGLGMYNNKLVDIPLAGDGETDFGFNIGAGLNFPLTGFSTFLEARFHMINTANEKTTFIPITFGLKF